MARNRYKNIKHVQKQAKLESKKEFYVPRTRNYARSRLIPFWQNFGSRSTQVFTPEQVELLLKNPYGNYLQLQEVSNYLWATSPMYQNIMYYLATLMSFDYMIFPDNSFTNSKKSLENRLFDSAKIIKQAQVKSTFPMMLLRTLVNGETYWYDLSDTNNTIMQEIDSRYCQLSGIDDDNLWRYYINLAKIPFTNILEMPDEIQIAYRKWVDGGKSKVKIDKVIDGVPITIPSNLYLVSKRGFSMFSHIRKTQHDYPFLASMFTDLIVLEENKAYLNESLRADIVKLVHLRIPIDKDSGQPIMDKETIGVYHESSKEHFPSNVSPLTNPFEVQSITFDKSQQNGINIAEHSQKVVQTSSGTSDSLFSASTTNGLGISITADATKMYPFLYYFDNIINYKIKSQKFLCSFLQINQYNRLEWHKQYGTDLANGMNRQLWMSTSNIEIYDFLNASKMEQILDFDQYLPVKLNANQMSGNDANPNGGRPEKDANDKADSTVTTDSYK